MSCSSLVSTVTAHNPNPPAASQNKAWKQKQRDTEQGIDASGHEPKTHCGAGAGVKADERRTRPPERPSKGNDLKLAQLGGRPKEKSRSFSMLSAPPQALHAQSPAGSPDPPPPAAGWDPAGPAAKSHFGLQRKGGKTAPCPAPSSDPGRAPAGGHRAPAPAPRVPAARGLSARPCPPLLSSSSSSPPSPPRQPRSSRRRPGLKGFPPPPAQAGPVLSSVSVPVWTLGVVAV